MRIIFGLFLLFVTLNAKIIEASYFISYGIFGEIGKVKTSLKTTHDSYAIKVEANTTGLARAISGDRDEIFVSKGKIINNTLAPHTYTHIVKRLKRKNNFSTNPQTWKKVLKQKNTFIRFHDSFITENKQIYFDGKLESNASKKLDFYAKNDILSMFFNFKDYNITKKTILYAVGAKGDNGELEIKPMSKAKQQNIFQDTSGHNFTIFINQPIFSSKKGELFVKIDNEGIGQIAMLKDVLFFGDIRAEIIDKKIIK